jgi:hypothetical protein
MSCPECNKRASEEKKALLDCKGNCEKLNTKAQRLSLVVAVLGTVLGKETLDMALGLESTLNQLAAKTEDTGVELAYEPSISFPSSPPKAPDPKTSGLSYMSAAVERENSLLSYVPPLTTFEWHESDPELFTWQDDTSLQNSMIVPFRNGLFLFGLAYLGHQQRRRNG